jgi:microcystin-dependent protein
MSDAYTGEIRMFGGNFAPAGWDFCEGQLLPISEYSALFNLIGTTYGGDGVNTFALPDLRGRLPVHMGFDANGNGYVMAQSGGTENVTLTSAQIPQHAHIVQGSPVGGSSNPSGDTFGGGQAVFSSSSPSVKISPSTVAQTGGSQPHTNLMPYLCVSFIIQLIGIYPSQT